MSSIKTKSMKSKFDVVNNQVRDDLPDFTSGDTIRVDVKIQEGDKYRIQAFEGLVIKTQGSGITYSVTVRKPSNGVFVERTFPLQSPIIDKVVVVKKGKVRRSRIYYIRNLKGKAARIEEVLDNKREDREGKKSANKQAAKKPTQKAAPKKAEPKAEAKAAPKKEAPKAEAKPAAKAEPKKETK